MNRGSETLEIEILEACCLLWTLNFILYHLIRRLWLLVLYNLINLFNNLNDVLYLIWVCASAGGPVNTLPA